MRTARLNAISRSYTQKAQKDAMEFLASKGIDFNDYCKKNNWKASCTRLATKIRKEKK